MITYATASTTLNAVRETTPLVSCITNSVVTNFITNALLAVGATPVMIDIVSEVGPFASVASVPLVNLGIPTPEQHEAARQAARAAHDAGVPWVLDPVAVGVLVHHTTLVYELLDFKPAVIRGSAPKIIALVGTGIEGHGVDAINEAGAALGAARALMQKTECVVVISEVVDAIVSTSEILRVGDGAEMLTRATGDGCALGAVSAASASVGRIKGLGDLESVAACHIVYSTVAECAEFQAAGPSTFAPLFFDALYSLEGIEPERIPLS